MKFTVQNSQFKKALNVAKRHVDSRSPLPILGCVLLKATDQGVTISSTNLTTSVSVSLSAEVQVRGGVAVPIKSLSSLVGKLSGETIFDSNDLGAVSIHNGDDSFHIVYFPEDEFPDVAFEKDQYDEFEIAQSRLELIVNQAVVFAAKKAEESRQIMTGLALHLGANELTMVSTDGRCMVVAKAEAETEVERERPFVVPAPALETMSKAAEKSESIVLGVSGSRVMVKTSDIVLYSQLLQGAYPDYTKVLPKRLLRSFQCDREYFIEALEKSMIFSNERDTPNLCRFSFSEDGLQICADTAGSGGSKVIVPGVYEGKPMMFGFNARYVRDALCSMTSAECLWRLQQKTKSSLVSSPHSPDEYQCIIMPVKLKDTGAYE